MAPSKICPGLLFFKFSVSNLDVFSRLTTVPLRRTLSFPISRAKLSCKVCSNFLLKFVLFFYFSCIMCISMLPKLSISILPEKAALCSVFLIQVTGDFLRHLELNPQSQHGLLPTRSPHHIQSINFSSVNSSSFTPFPYHSLPAG